MLYKKPEKKQRNTSCRKRDVQHLLCVCVHLLVACPLHPWSGIEDPLQFLYSKWLAYKIADASISPLLVHSLRSNRARRHNSCLSGAFTLEAATSVETFLYWGCRICLLNHCFGAAVFVSLFTNSGRPHLSFQCSAGLYFRCNASLKA
jgi:hypothetical protein